MPVTVAAEHAGGGPYYFAWVDADETEFDDEHIRYDDYILSFSIAQKEGDFATLTIEIPNPGKGLLAPDRKVWAWLAWNAESGDSDSDSETEVVPLFFGRVVGLPTDLLKETITVQFTARPVDYVSQKNELAEDLRQLPEYDEVFVDEAHRDDADTVLEGYSRIWHSDRVSHEVTTSDFLVGEDGVVIFDGVDALYDSVEVTLETFPQTSIDYDASVTWNQQGTGTIDFGRRIFSSYTASTIASGWPTPESSLQAGWSVASSKATLIGGELAQTNFSVSWQNQAKVHEDGDTMSISISLSAPSGYGPDAGITLTQSGTRTIGDPYTGTPASASSSRTGVIIDAASLAVTTLVLKYDMDRKREEHLKFTLVSDIQEIMDSQIVDSEDKTSDVVKINGVDVGLPIENVVPIGDLSRGSYFETDRGLRSVENLICRARAKLILMARAARVSWDCQFSDAVLLSCRKNAILHDPRVSGGEAIGKIISYDINGTGDTGEFVGRVTIACAVGTGVAIMESGGTPDYVEDGYVDAGYQTRTGEIVFASSAGDVGYAPPHLDLNEEDLVLPLTKRQVVVREEVINSFEDQKDVLARVLDQNVQVIENPSDTDRIRKIAEEYIKNITDALERKKQLYELELKSVIKDADANEYNLTLTELSIPKQIDLADTGI